MWARRRQSRLTLAHEIRYLATLKHFSLYFSAFESQLACETNLYVSRALRAFVDLINQNQSVPTLRPQVPTTSVLDDEV